MKDWEEQNSDGIDRWEENAGFWDEYMGEAGNVFHRDIIRPDTERLLEVERGDRVLDIACGNGNFSRRLASLGARVVAFDASATMIERVRKRTAGDQYSVQYRVLDAADADGLLRLGERSFDRAVANMALMDIGAVEPLLTSLARLLRPGGTFVFSVAHPCFQPPGSRKVCEEEDAGGEVVKRKAIQIFRYIRPESHLGLAVCGQPTESRYFHRPLALLLENCFSRGFMMDGIAEPVFCTENEDAGSAWTEIPPALIVRMILR